MYNVLLKDTENNNLNTVFWLAKHNARWVLDNALKLTANRCNDSKFGKIIENNKDVTFKEYTTKNKSHTK